MEKDQIRAIGYSVATAHCLTEEKTEEEVNHLLHTGKLLGYVSEEHEDACFDNDSLHEHISELAELVIHQITRHAANNGEKKLESIYTVDLGVSVEFDGMDKSDEVLPVAEAEADFDKCPHCDSDNIDYGDVEPGGAFIYRTHRCLACDTTWEERYDLVKVAVTCTKNNKEEA